MLLFQCDIYNQKIFRSKLISFEAFMSIQIEIYIAECILISVINFLPQNQNDKSFDRAETKKKFY